MLFWGKVSRNFKALGSKVAGAASFLGNKVGNTLMAISPVATLINPAIGAGLAGAGAIAKGIGALGDLGQSLMTGTTTLQDARQGGAGVRAIVQGAGAVRDAYMAYQSRSPLERPG